VVSVLAIGPKIYGLKPSLGKWLFRAIKIHTMTSFGVAVKPLIPYDKFSGHVKRPYEYERGYFVGKI
jgi:hypothetical protein